MNYAGCCRCLHQPSQNIHCFGLALRTPNSVLVDFVVVAVVVVIVPVVVVPVAAAACC